MKVENTKIQKTQLETNQKASQQSEQTNHKFSDELQELESAQKSTIKKESDNNIVENKNFDNKKLEFNEKVTNKFENKNFDNKKSEFNEKVTNKFENKNFDNKKLEFNEKVKNKFENRNFDNKKSEFNEKVTNKIENRNFDNKKLEFNEKVTNKFENKNFDDKKLEFNEKVTNKFENKNFDDKKLEFNEKVTNKFENKNFDNKKSEFNEKVTNKFENRNFDNKKLEFNEKVTNKFENKNFDDKKLEFNEKVTNKFENKNFDNKKSEFNEKVTNKLENKNFDNKKSEINEKVINKFEDKTYDNKNLEIQEEKHNVEFAINNLNKIVEKLSQSDEKKENIIKKEKESTDTEIMINKDYSIQDKDLLPQMNPNMNFGSNGQPFSSFMNNDSKPQNQESSLLGNSAQDLKEEAAILSTMAENISIANKKMIVQESKEVEVIDETGIKKVDVKTNIITETIVKYDSIIMNQADVEVFAELVQKGELNLNEINTQSTEKSVQVSKTLADMLAKAMEDNKPIRINFDNDISVIIKISRDGKIRADFLPSSQVAEAYLKENLPLLRQKFDNSNLEYDSLNQRERRENNKDNNRKKGQNNE